MSAKSIESSVEEELVYIGAALKRTLRDRIGDRVHAPGGNYCGAEVKAEAEGKSFEVSWAPTVDSRRVRNAMIWAYVKRHGHTTGYESMTGEWFVGNTAKEHQVVSAHLNWSPWRPLDDSTLGGISEEIGVYRIRIAARQ